MLNKNRMMVFKNKGKDQEVSGSPFPPSGEVTESLARQKLSAADSRRSHVRRPARCHLFPPRTCACVYTCELFRFPPDFSLSSLFLPYLFLPLISFYPFCYLIFLSFRVLYFFVHFISLLPFLFFSFTFFSPLNYCLLSSLLFYLLLLL